MLAWVLHKVSGTASEGWPREAHMSNELKPKPDRGSLMVYEIRIMGHLSHQWTDWFGGLAIKLEDNGQTLLTGPVIDQSALHGLIRKVSDLGMPLISVVRVEPE